MPVCLFIRGRSDCLQIFRVDPRCSRHGFRRKNTGSRVAFFVSRGTTSHAPLKADWALSTAQAIGAHIGAGGQCTDEIKAGVGADRPARIHSYTRVRESRP